MTSVYRSLMGVDYHAVLVLGFHINNTDLWQEVSSEPHCECGRAPDGNGPFCAKCGTKFEVHVDQEPTPGFAKLCEQEDLDPESFQGLSYDGGLGLFSSAEIHGYDDRDADPLFGFRLERTGSPRNGPGPTASSIPVERLIELQGQLRKFQQVLGIYPRDIGLFTSIEVG